MITLTFVHRISEVIIDLTLVTNAKGIEIGNWGVLLGVSFSIHRKIFFDINRETPKKMLLENQKGGPGKSTQNWRKGARKS